MIPKGNQRSGGQQLATHLLNALDNERVEVAEVRGAIAQDLHGAFKEWQAIAKGTLCQKYLYSLSVNPDHRQAAYDRAHYLDFIERAEKALGLVDQPRAVVFHVKNGREHCHVVWSRIDTEKLKAVHMPHDRQKLRKVAQDFARDYGLTLPEGMRQDRGKERFKEHEKHTSLAERQQEERTGISKEERRRAITDAWNKARTGEEFVRELTARDYYIAKGDKRAYVVVDLYGEIHSLARQIKGASAKDIKARMADYPLDQLPDTLAAQDFARQRREENLKLAAQREQPTPDQRREKLAEAHRVRRQSLEALRQAMRDRQALERYDLEARHKAERAALSAERERTQPRGFWGLVSRLSGYDWFTSWRQGRQDRQRSEAEKEELQKLRRRHQREQRDFQRHERSLTRLERREFRSLETRLRREQYQAARKATPELAVSLAPGPKAEPALRKDFERAAQKPEPQPEAARDTRRQKLTPAFNEKALDQETSGKDRSQGGSLQPAPDVQEQTPSTGPRAPFADAASREKADFQRSLREAAERKAQRGPDLDPGRELTPPGRGR